MKSPLADPKILMAMKNLQLAAKATVDGFLSGLHNSKINGAGLEFSRYRSYEPGDDLRQLDWKMFARSDRYFIRESEIETSISVQFVIDASASMNHEDEGISKIDYAKYLAASLAYLAGKQGDSLGLHLLQNNRLFTLPSRKDFEHLSRIFFQLEQIIPAGTFTEPAYYKNLFSNTKKELLIFITDYYERNGEITKLLTSFSNSRHEIIVFHLLAKNEAEPEFAGYAALEDYETGETIRINFTKDKIGYKKRLADYIQSIRAELLNRNISYELITMNTPLDMALQQFLKRRIKLKR